MAPVRINPTPGTVWRMKTGIVTVVGVANEHKANRDPDYPVTVIYRTAAGDLECRSIGRFRSSAVEPVTCTARREQDEMVCSTCARRWDVTDVQPCSAPTL